MINIYLARHGETEYNRRNQIQGRGIDASLNETGLRQARDITGFLQDTPIQKVVSSSLKRSIETASEIARNKKLDLVSYADLDEMDFGHLEGKPISNIEDDLKELHQRWKSGDVEHSCRGGESPAVVFDRANKRAQMILGQNIHNVLFVLHGRLLRILLSQWLQYGLHQMHRIPHSNGALYHLQWNNTEFEAVYLNKTDHLFNEQKN
ncbi:histidine phosphatase family protein [Fodinibius sp. Rm-B-1B1-1]|uniref:histidine phosphatase family protein n=1 Tax=Fodinibius alkaliphilus TaxID=3140241 RepID=UPI00315A197D